MVYFISSVGARIDAANWTIPGFIAIPYLTKIIDENLDPAAIGTEFSQRFLTSYEEKIKALYFYTTGP